MQCEWVGSPVPVSELTISNRNISCRNRKGVAELGMLAQKDARVLVRVENDAPQSLPLYVKETPFIPQSELARVCRDNLPVLSPLHPNVRGSKAVVYSLLVRKPEQERELVAGHRGVAVND